MTATRTTPRKPIAADRAVVPTTLSNDDLMALLGQTGVIAQQSNNFHRMTLKGGILETDDGEMFPPKKNGPALRVRIVKPPVYYNAIFLSDDEKDGAVDAGRVGRSDLNGRFARKYDDPQEQAQDNNPANDIYDDLVKVTGHRGAFKGDIQVQIVPESGELTGNETVYTLSLSTTSVFEWRGSTRAPSEGSVSDKNFIVKLAELAVANAVTEGADEAGQKRAVLDAMTSLRIGGVIAEVYLLRATNEKSNQTWTVISFNPIYVEPLNETPALRDPTTVGPEENGDDVPF